MTNWKGSPEFDPMCGMSLEAAQIAASYTYIDRTYFFWGEECRNLFGRAPEVHIALLAHEPGSSASFQCPHQRQLIAPRWSEPGDATMG